MGRAIQCLAVILATLPGCSDPDPVVYRRPSAEEKAAREAFVESHPELPAVIKRQLVTFEVTPQTATRRVDYVRSRPDLPGGLKQLILAGSVRLHMKAEYVRAAWGEPEEREVKGRAERWVYPSFSPSDPSRKVELFFQDDAVVRIRN